MHRRTFSSALGSAAFVLVCASAVPAIGQTDEQRAGARSLATEGASAFSDGRYKDAVDLFSKAESLVHAPPHLLFIARAHVKLNQLVRAREAYLKITREQIAPNAPQAFRDAQSASAREMAAIEPKIGALTVKVEGPADAKDLQVKLDGTLVPSVLVGSSQPVDPGEHHVEAVAMGFRAQPRTIKVGDGERTSVTLKLDADPNSAPTSVGAPKMGEPATASSAAGVSTVGGQVSSGGSSAPGDTGTSGGSGMRIGAYTAFGIGAVGVGLGTFFILRSSSKRTEADNLCAGGCKVENRAAIDDADSAADSARTLSIVGFAVGGASVVTGILLLVLDKGSDTKSASVRPWVGLGSAGVMGRF